VEYSQWKTANSQNQKQTTQMCVYQGRNKGRLSLAAPSSPASLFYYIILTFAFAFCAKRVVKAFHGIFYEREDDDEQNDLSE
jgi:hypothetical protein